MIDWLKNRLSSIVVYAVVVIISVIFMILGGMNWIFTIITVAAICFGILINYYLMYKKEISVQSKIRLQKISILKDLSKNKYSSLDEILKSVNNEEYEIILNMADGVLKNIENSKDNIINRFISEKNKCNDYLDEWQIVTKEALNTVIDDVNKIDFDNAQTKIDKATVNNHIKILQRDIAQLIYFYTSISGNTPEISSVKLRHITMSIMKRYSKIFLKNKINTSFKMVEKTINTNIEYLNYILDSLIDTAVKCGAKSIKITSKEDENGTFKLVMIDNGIGINTQDESIISRYSSKRDRIDLFVCKSLCEYMGYKLYMTSEDVTTVEIIFS